MSRDGSSLPTLPSPALTALTWDLLASLACNARFQIFLAEVASRRSREHRIQMNFLLPLPILQLVEGVFSQMFRKEGPSPQVGPMNGEQKCAYSARLS